MQHGQLPKDVRAKIRIIEGSVGKPKHQDAARRAWAVIRRSNCEAWALRELSAEARTLLGLE